MVLRARCRTDTPLVPSCQKLYSTVRATSTSNRCCALSSQVSEVSQTTIQQKARILTPELTLSNNVVGTGSRRSRSETLAKCKQTLKVAVDVDEVLGRFLHSLNKYCLEEFGSKYDITDYREYNFAKVWNCTLDEANRRVHHFFQSHHFAVGILPIPGALHSLRKLRESCDLVVVTSRQHVIQQQTVQWLAMHFPDIFQEVHFGNHWALSGDSKRKSEICRTQRMDLILFDICREIGAKVLIDDNPMYAMDCAEAGINVLLYDWQLAYPWAKTADGPQHPLIQRVANWSDVELALGALAEKR